MTWKFSRPQFEYEKMYTDLGGPWSGHKYFGYDLILNLKPKLVVELGTHLGCSLFSFGQAVKDSKSETTLDGIDTWLGDQHTSLYDEVIFSRINEIKRKCYPKVKINFVRKTFDEANSEYAPHSIDILHIDGLHTYKAIKHDFNNWLGKVKTDGLILFHDINVKKWGFGIYKLWSELKHKYATIEFQHSYGLGILFLNSKIYNDFKLHEGSFQIYYPLLAEKEDLNWQIRKALEKISGYETTLNKYKLTPFYSIWKLFKRMKLFNLNFLRQ